MTNKAGFNIALSEIIEEANPIPGHPFLTIARFVFADDKPNQNNQAVSYAEFENIRNTAVGMPVKMNFGADVGDHVGSIPIGVIRKLDEATLPDNTHQLIAEAVLWNEEYPEEVDYLKTAFAEGKAPGISYELGYKDSETISGIQWLKNVITLAATFVKHPAYGIRTPLLALASLKTPNEFASEIQTIATNQNVPFSEILSELHKLEAHSSNEGGNKMDEELQQAKAQAATLATEIEALKSQIVEKDTALETAHKENESLRFSALLDKRTREFVEAGFTVEADAEKAERKNSLWTSLNDDQWTEYLGDLKEAKKSVTPLTPKEEAAAAAIAKASAAANPAPRLDAMSDMGIQTLSEAMRQLARPHSA